MAKISFIGLGNMGAGMAQNILNAGHELTVFDLNHGAMQSFVKKGAKAASSASESVQAADAIITMLPAGTHVKSVYLGTDGLISSARKGAVMMDCSTIDVDSARLVITAATKAGMKMVDAPVSGGVAAAASGSLTFMVGGSDDAFNAAEKILSNMGVNIIHAGKAGTGQAAKICNNMMLGIQMVSVSEAFILAEKLGLEAQKLFDISSKASGQCWSLTSYCPAPKLVPTSPANNDYKAGFSAAMMLKDLRLAQEAAAASGAVTPLGRASQELYEEFTKNSSDDMDFSGIINMIRDYK